MSAREDLLCTARKQLWRAWSTSSEELGSAAVDTLMGLGMLVPEGGAAELERLRLLFNAQPASLTEEQVDALADVGNRALNDHYHDDLCHCSDWPESCASSGHYFAGSWDTAAFGIGMTAVIGAWEAMRAPAEAAELSRLRDRVAELETDLNGRGEDLAAAVAGWGRSRDRVAELERCQGAAGIAVHRINANGWQCEADATTAIGIRNEVEAIRRTPVEDPYDSPLHHDYKFSRDLPEVPHA
ncbi:hypothetical protein ACFXD5_06825 [Streptomyces sp. NPDC059385]|uniref:hypothetical protein n=1 Tax=Streptomyces sp. NPDC059385 TaxID=3346817 RepID=UPI003685B145